MDDPAPADLSDDDPLPLDDLTGRAALVLERAGIRTMDELRGFGLARLAGLPEVGPRTLEQLRPYFRLPPRGTLPLDATALPPGFRVRIARSGHVEVFAPDGRSSLLRENNPAMELIAALSRRE